MNFRGRVSVAWCGTNWALVERANLRGVSHVIGQTVLSNFPVATAGISWTDNSRRLVTDVHI